MEYPTVIDWASPFSFSWLFCGILHFIQILVDTYVSNSGDPDQTPRSVASDLGLHGLPMFHKKDAWSIGVKECKIVISFLSINLNMFWVLIDSFE